MDPPPHIARLFSRMTAITKQNKGWKKTGGQKNIIQFSSLYDGAWPVRTLHYNRNVKKYLTALFEILDTSEN